MLSNWIYTVPKALALPWRKFNSITSEMQNLGGFCLEMHWAVRSKPLSPQGEGWKGQVPFAGGETEEQPCSGSEQWSRFRAELPARGAADHSWGAAPCAAHRPAGEGGGREG